MKDEDKADLCGAAVVFGLLVMAVAIVLALAGCRHAAPPAPAAPPIRVVTVRRDCAAAPPPALPTGVAWAGQDDGCPAAFATCLTADSFRALLAYVGELQAWTRNTWAACGPLDPQPTEAP